MNIFLFVATVLIWGTTWIAIAFQIGPIPILVSVFYRFALAAVVLFFALVLIGKFKKPSYGTQPFILIQALCLFSINFLCFYSAAAYIPSGMISVIFSLATIYNAINARIFFKDSISAPTIFAAILGVTGLIMLFGRDVMSEMTSSSLSWNTLKGISFAALGTLLFSFGNMASRHTSANGTSPVIASTWGMAYGAVILMVLIVSTGAPLIAPQNLTYTASLLYLSVVGSVAGFTVYLSLVSRIGTAKAAYATVLFPIVALGLSTVYEGYQWHLESVFGLILALLGNVVMFARGLNLREKTG